MKRRFFTGLSAVAFLVFFAILLLWTRYLLGLEDTIYVHFPSSRIRIDMSDGTIMISKFPRIRTDRTLPFILIFDDTDRLHQPLKMRQWEQEGVYGDLWGWASNPHSLMGFGYSLGASRPNFTYTFICIFPFWVLVLIAGLPLIGPTRRVLRIRRREKHRLCPNCGYDIRASSDKCPECGIDITTSKPIEDQEPPLAAP